MASHPFHLSADALFGRSSRRSLALWPVVVGTMPGLVGIIPLHALECLERIRPEIFFVNHPIWTDHECLHARNAILGRCSSQREPSDHRPFHYEIHFALRSGRSLSLQHLEIITMIWLPTLGVALLKSFGDFLANWSAPCSVGVSPGEPIMFAGRANDFLGVLVNFRIVVFLLRIFMLRVNKPATDRDRVQLVRPNAPV